MNCEEVRELLAAYALDALSEEERAAVREHLDGCALHPELAELRATIEALAGSAGELEPPAELRARVLALAAAPPSTGGRGDAPIPLASRRRSLFLPWALAASVAALAILLGWWSTTREATAPVLVTRTGTAVVGPSQARLTYSPESRELVFEVESLAPLPPDLTYQLWVVRGATPESLGVFTTSGAGHGVVRVQTSLVEGETLAVSIEPAGGSAAPTTEPLLAVRV